MRHITQADLEDLALGSAVLGAGGGGRAHLGTLMAREAIGRHGTVTLVDPAELPDDALVVSIAMIGAPMASVEKIPSGTEGILALQGIEQLLGRKATHLFPAEAGGLNSLIPFPVAAREGLPIVDADGMGRAFPELQMLTATLFGIPAAPLVLVDTMGDTVTITATRSNLRTERLARAATVEMGSTAIMAMYAMSGADVKRALIHGMLSKALRIGAALREARHSGADPVLAALTEIGGFQLFEGKIVDVDRRTTRGFSRGEIVIDGDAGRLEIEFQNENLVARDASGVIASTPDLIILLERDTGAPVMTEDLRYGLRVAVLGAPSDAHWRTAAGLELAGPGYFGYEFEFRPIEDAVLARGR
jgi:uncharacterized protein